LNSLPVWDYSSDDGSKYFSLKNTVK